MNHVSLSSISNPRVPKTVDGFNHIDCSYNFDFCSNSILNFKSIYASDLGSSVKFTGEVITNELSCFKYSGCKISE